MQIYKELSGAMLPRILGCFHEGNQANNITALGEQPKLT
jgi:hypothetical protein